MRTRFDFDSTTASPHGVVELMTDFSPNRRTAGRHCRPRRSRCHVGATEADVREGQDFPVST
ncbi:hypothetical protein L843_5189 [Mycobacterium intracellulare MIN_061107_1834]|nr:hypothetical protein L843_5189 [Mycobacterium intracellulare MIN_061107_1834]